MQSAEFLALGFCSNDHIAVLPFIPHDTKVRMLSLDNIIIQFLLCLCQ